MLQPDDLAALACEEGIEARLVFEERGGLPWQVRHGRFHPSEFAELPERGWSLLVQEVNRWVDPVAELLEAFRFLPHWRIEDVMVSYAPAGGSVGAHVDAYDVFLIQGPGRRRWSIESTPRADPAWRPGLDLKILRSFEPDLHWELEPGDMLYLPPGLPHHGVNLEAGMTFSVGLRAPARNEWQTGWIREALLPSLDAPAPDDSFCDPDRTPTDRPGRIAAADLARLRGWIEEIAGDRIGLNRWIGSYLTRPRGIDPQEIESDVSFGESELPLHPNAGEIAPRLRRSAPADFAWIPLDDAEDREGHDGGAVDLFVGGRRYLIPHDLRRVAEWLCDEPSLSVEALGALAEDSRVRWLLDDLIDRGFLLPFESG